jgi:capsular exopolysaccharide synthesis family protein
LLTTGPLPPNPSELLSSKRLKELVELLKTKADIVIFDSSPLLAVADAAVMTSVVDGVVFVIGAGESHQRDGIRSQETMREIGANLLGVVLTKFNPSQVDRYYYYGYYQDEKKRARDGRKRGPVSRWDRLKQQLKWRKN